MAQVDFNQLDGFFKDVFADRLENLIPETAYIKNKIPFAVGNRTGQFYSQPVMLTHEQGITYAASAAGAFTLNAAAPMTTVEAQVTAGQIAIRSAIDYESAASAAGSKQAFARTMDTVIRNMNDSMVKRLEINYLHGRSSTGIGQSSTASSTNSTTEVLTISDATWSAGIWSGAEGAVLEAYQGSNQIGGDFTVSAVSQTNRTVTVTGSSANIASLHDEIDTSGNTCTLYFKSAYGNEAYGIDAVVTNTGTLHNISATTYALWAGNSYSVSGAMTVAHFYGMLALAADRGLQGKCFALYNPTIWSDFMALLADNRRYDGSYSKDKSDYGFETLKLYSSTGVVDVVPHIYMKVSEAFLMPEGVTQRIGATDLTFNNPGKGSQFFRELADSAGFEIRAYSHQTLFVEKPAFCCKSTGITT